MNLCSTAAAVGVWAVTVEAKDTEVKELLETRDQDLGEMKKRLKAQERERQSELLKLQMEVNQVTTSGTCCLLFNPRGRSYLLHV